MDVNQNGKRYAAGLEMRCPGGVYPNWAAQSPATIIEQGPCQGDVIGPHNWDDFAAGFNLSPQRVVISAATNTVGELRSDRVQGLLHRGR